MKSQAHLFDLPDHVHYLNCAYMSPSTMAVMDAGIDGIRQKSRPYQVSASDFFEQGALLRQSFGKLINADPDQIAKIPSVSYGISTVAKNLHKPKGSNIVVSGEQFPSNVYTWRRVAEEAAIELRIVEAPDSFEGRGAAWNQLLLEAIDDRTSIVALPHCHWTDGTLFDLKAIRSKSSKVGAALVIDGTQSVGALPFDVALIEPDALVCGGYKWLMGPYSLGLMYLHPKYNDGVPLEENWIARKASENFSGLVAYEDSYQSGALRYEVGENSNFILVPMLLQALTHIHEWTPQGVQKYCQEITRDGISMLKENGFWTEEPAYRGNHLFGIRPKQAIDVQHLRDVLERKNIFVSIRGTSIRVAPHVYNTRDSFDLLVQTVIDETRS